MFTDNMPLAATGALVAIALLAICALWLKAQRGKKRTSSVIVEPIRAAEAFGRALTNVTFRDAIQFVSAGNKLAESLMDEVNSHLTQNSGERIVIGLKAVNGIEARNLMLAKFSSETVKLLKKDSAVLLSTKDGEQLLVAIDKNGKRFLSQAHKVDPSAVARLANISAFVVGAAHVISGYDNAKKLKSIDAKLDLQLSLHANSLVSQLESIFESLKENLLSNATESKDVQLRTMSLRLKELRSRWFLDIESNLKTMRDPKNRNAVVKLFSAKKTTARALLGKLSEQEGPLYLIRFAVQMEEIIAEALGEHDAFSQVAIPSIRRKILELAEIVKEREEWIKDQSGTTEAAALIDYCEKFEKSLPA